MILDYLELNNYNRLYLSSIQNIKYIPKKPIQIILASNGSGKSSLLKEVIPNVEELNIDYDKNGYKIAKYTHKNDKYILSYNRDKNKHSFKKNGEELNQAGLKKTQYVLIEEYFGVNKYIHELLLGTTKFTNMSISERRKWFTDILTTVDYKNALLLYNNVKVELKDLTSFIKLTQSKILNTQEKKNNIKQDDIDKWNNDKKIFYTFIDNITKLKSNMEPVKQVDMERMDILSKDIEKAMLLIEDKPDKQKVINDILRLTTKKRSIEDRLNDITDKINKVNEYKIDNNIDLNKLKSEFKVLDQKLNKIKESFKLVDMTDVIRLVKWFKSVYMDLKGLYEEYTSIDSKEIDKDTLYRKIETITKDVKKIDSDIITLRSDIKHLLENKDHDPIECPKCKNIFKKDFDELTLLNKTKELKNKTFDKDELEKELEELNIDYKNLIRRSELEGNIRNTLDYDLSFIKNIILAKTNDLKIMDNFNNVLNELLINLPDIDNLETDMKRYDTLKYDIDFYSNLGTEKLNFILKRRDELKREQVKLIDEKNELDKDINGLKVLKGNYDKIEIAVQELEMLYKGYKRYNKYRDTLLFDNFINDCIHEAKIVITDLEDKLLEVDRLDKYLKELEQDLDKFNSEKEAVSKLEVYLSPSKGIIGEAITKTINIILEDMNNIINEIWTYNIDIQPCNIEENDLTFRFPVLLNNIKTISDVSKGSVGIKEVIDLAFKITSMKMLDLLDSPLILDEFGSNMDEVHRIRSYEFIEGLSKTVFSQVFLVSHYKSMYNRFNNTDVIVLNNDNIAYNGSYNEIVKIS